MPSTSIQMLQIRWRRWLTRRYLGAWLADHAYYQLQLRDTTDNPDQRIGSTRFKSPTSCAAHRRRANRRRLHLPPTATGGGRTRGDDAGAVLWSRSMVSGFQPDERRGGDWSDRAREIIHGLNPKSRPCLKHAVTKMAAGVAGFGGCNVLSNADKVRLFLMQYRRRCTCASNIGLS